MRCRDAKYWLTTQREGDALKPERARTQEHLVRCSTCRTYEQRQQRLDTLFGTPASRTYHTISTDRIMHAVQRQRRISQQLADIRAQQQMRVARLHIVPGLAAIAFISVGILALLLLAVDYIQPELLVNILAGLGSVIDVLIVATQSAQTMLSLITRNDLLLSGAALVLVVMMGMWLRLMRYPQEA